MSLKPLKSYLPKSLYGRAALILLLPVISLQLLVSVVFIQRHFEGVTVLMTKAVERELTLILDSPPASQSALAEALEIEIRTVDEAPTADRRGVFDFSGRAMISTLRDRLDGVLAVDLSNRREVVVWIERGPIYRLEFQRVRVSASNPHQLIVIMVVMGTVLTIVAYIFLRNQLRPIRRLANAAAEYGKGRMVTYNPGGANEVRAAGTAFIEMRSRIERLNQSRTMMLAGISHDLRTPITRLRLGLSLIDEDDAAPMIEDVADMEKLVAAFLDYGRADAGEVAEPTSPLTLVTRAVEDAVRAGQNVTLIDTGNVSPSMVMPLRELALRRAVENLIGNALRYGATKAEVSMVLTERTLRITVEDDGPGIPFERREEAMRPFVRLDPARNQNQGTGVGLGLAIVADVARLHGGTLRLTDSERLGGLQADIVIAR